MRVTAVLGHQDSRLVYAKNLWHHGVERSKPVGVGAAGRKCDIHRRAFSSPPTYLGRKTRAGEQVRRRLVQADSHHPRVFVEDRLYAVAMVHIHVDIAHPLTAVVQQPADGEGNVVVNAEAARRAGHRVMQASADVAGALRIASPDPAGRLDTCHGDPSSDLVHSGKDRIVACAESVPLIGLTELHSRDVVRSMHGLQHRKIDLGWWHDLKPVQYAKLASQGDRVGDPTRRHRMIRSEVVFGQIVREDEQPGYPWPVPCLSSRAAAARSRLRSRAASMARKKAARTL